MSDRSAPIVQVALHDFNQAGLEIIDLTSRLIRFTFEDSDRKMDKMELILDNDDLSLFDSEVFLRGQVLSVSWGYPGNMSQPRAILVAKITGFKKLKIEGFPPRAMAMNRAQRARTFDGMTDSEIVAHVANSYGFPAGQQFIQNRIKMHNHNEAANRINVQAAETDAQFLRRLASRTGWEFYVDDTGIHFHDRQFGATPVRSYRYHHDPERGDILRFNVTSEVFRRSGGSTVEGRDPLTREDITGKGDNVNTAPERLAEENDQTEYYSLDADEIAVAVQEINELTEALESGDIPDDEALAMLIDMATSVGAIQESSPGTSGDAWGWLSELPSNDEESGWDRIMSALPATGSSVEEIAATRHGAQLSLDTGTIYAGAGEAGAMLERTGRSSLNQTTEATAEDAQERANARYRLSVRNTFEATMDIVGDPEFRAKSIITVVGISDQLSGNYYVKEAKHEIQNGYKINIKLIRDGSGRYARRLSGNAGRVNNEPADPGVLAVLATVADAPNSDLLTTMYEFQTGRSVDREAPTQGEIIGLMDWMTENGESISDQLNRSPTEEEQANIKFLDPNTHGYGMGVLENGDVRVYPGF